MEQAAYLRNGGEEAARALAASSSRRVTREGTGGVAARLAGAAGQQLAPRGRRRAGWRGDRGRARGGGDDRCRAGWRWRPRCGEPSGVGAGGEESAKNARKKMALVYIYMPRPITPGAIPPAGVNVLYSRCVLPTGSKCIPLLPVGNTPQE